MAPVTLVLLPGLDGTGLLFGPLVAALPAGLRAAVVRYPVDRSMGYAELAASAAEQLPQGERFVLVGESFGGPLAMILAAGRPAGLVGLVLCATFVTSPRPLLGRLVRPFVARPGRVPSADPVPAGHPDHVVPAANLQRVQRLRPDVKSAPVPSGHQDLQRRPAECAAAIACFLKRLIEKM